MSPDGEAIVTGAGDETLRFWNVFSKTRSTKVRRGGVGVPWEPQPWGELSELAPFCSLASDLLTIPCRLRAGCREGLNFEP